MSNRLTFSLASLFLIFALVFVAMPVMAATGGPTVTIAHGQAAAKQTRAVFKLKFTFDVAVTGFEAGDATYQYYAKDGMPLGAVESITPVAVTNKPAEYTVDLNLSSPEANAVGIIVVVNADGATGNNALSSKHGITNQAKSMRFDLPPEYIGKVIIEAKKDATDTDTSDGQDYDLTFTFKDTHATAGVEPSPALTAELVTVEPSYVSTMVTLGTGATDSATSGKDWVYKGSITHPPMGAPTLTIGLVTSYVKAADVTTAMVPPAEAPDPVPPMAMITIEDYMLADDEGSFFISVMFSDGDTVKPAMLGVDLLDVKDSSDPAQMVTLTEGLNQKMDNSYKARMTFDYDPRFITLPLVIKVNQSTLKTSNPDYAKMVGESDTTPPVLTLTKGDPDATTGAVTVTIASNEALKAAPTVSAMGMPAGHDATYMVSAVMMGTAANTYMVTVTPTAAADLTADVPALTVTLTVMAMDTSDNSVTMGNTIDVMLAARTAPTARPPGPPTGVTAKADQAANTIAITWTAPASDGGSAITRYTVTKHYMKDGAAATKDFDAAATANSLMIPPTGSTDMLPKGVSFTFTVSATNSAGTGPASDPSAAVVIEEDPTVPGVPTNLEATANQAANTITLTWDAPADNGGATITSYSVMMNGRTQRPVTATNFTASRLTAGTYTFTVAATNSVGTGAPTGSKAAVIDPDPIVTPPPTPGAPSAPTNVEAIANQDTNIITVTWGAPTNDGGARITSYSVKMNGAVQRPVTATNFTTSRLPAGTYTFEVAAVNSRGTGPTASDAAVINPDPIVTPPPQGLPPTALIDSTISLPAASIGPNQFIVLQRNPADSGLYAQVPTVTVGLANLDHLLRDRGGIALLGAGSANDLVFSEIMWGSDSSLADDTHSQWIELYNTTNRTLSLSNYMLKFYSGQIGATPNAIDEINTINWGSLHGQRGRTRGEDTQGRFSEPVEIISMYLKINYPRVERSQARGEQLKDFPNGSAHGHWAASARPSLNIESTWRLATPGAKPRFTVHGASTLRQNVIITEFGNSSEDGYDWVEIYNTTDGVINLKKWELSYVSVSGGMGKETSLFRFPDNDSHRLPGKSFLVIASTDPKNSGNDLAAGIDITKKGIDQTTKGLGTWIGGGSGNDKNINALYTVRSFKLPNGTARTNIILRHDQGKLGKADKFEDVVGTLKVELRGPVVSGWTGYDANSQTYYDTAFWPLHATGAPHGNVIDGTDAEDFRAGRVIQRNDLGKGTRTGIHEKKLSVRGWTGIGYDLDADRNNENGGTPGYHKDSLKSKASEVAGTVNISEIMIATDEDSEAGRVPRATRLPQWIELYNSSMTQGVNINNWYFEIHNSSLDRDVNLSGTLRLPNVTIPPNQTVMIVSSSGLNSGNFSEARTINLYTNNTYRSVLNLRSRGDSVLSSEGFYIELRDHENNYVDEIGNLGVTRRTGLARRDDTAEIWDIGADYLNFEGHRTSLIRVYDDRTGMARDGLLKTSWRPAAMTNFREVPSLTYYGNHRDFGTPGYRGGGPLPVELSKFRPQRLDTGEVVIHWATESELNNAGFNILRTEKRDGVFQQVNTELIKGHGTTSERNTYTWTDTTAKPNVVYYYQIQDVSLDGQVQTLRISRLKGNVSATGKATTTWGELKSLQ